MDFYSSSFQSFLGTIGKVQWQCKDLPGIYYLLAVLLNTFQIVALDVYSRLRILLSVVTPSVGVSPEGKASQDLDFLCRKRHWDLPLPRSSVSCVQVCSNYCHVCVFLLIHCTNTSMSAET